MRFLLLNQFYPPDSAPTGRYLHDLARTLVQRGHEVKVLCSRQSYGGGERFASRQILDGVEVQRLRATGFGRRGYLGKIADYTSFCASLLLGLLSEHRKPDLILSLTTPPYVGLLGKLGAKRHRCRHAHWIMDLYPDVIYAHGLARANGVSVRFLRWLTRLQLRGAHFVLALGPMMAEKVAAYVEEKGGESRNEPGVSGPWSVVSSPSVLRPPTSVLRPRSSDLGPPSSDPCPPSSVLRHIPLWTAEQLAPWPDSHPNPLRLERKWAADEVVFLYSGNMGLGHRFDEFLQAANRLGASGPRWAFAGGGKRRSEIEAFASATPTARIELFDYVPHALLQSHLCAADVHLASLDSAWQGLMVPSKLQASFAVGRPVLYVGGQDNETARWILESTGGWVVAENDIEGLMAVINQALDPEERRRRGHAAFDFAMRNFQLQTNCSRLAELLESGNSLKAETLKCCRIHAPEQEIPEKAEA